MGQQKKQIFGSMLNHLLPCSICLNFRARRGAGVAYESGPVFLTLGQYPIGKPSHSTRHVAEVAKSNKLCLACHTVKHPKRSELNFHNTHMINDLILVVKLKASEFIYRLMGQLTSL